MQVITRYKAFDGTLFMECDTCREYEADHRYELGVSTIHFYDCVGQDITILCFDDYNRFNEIERIVLDNQVAVEICTSILAAPAHSVCFYQVTTPMIMKNANGRRRMQKMNERASAHFSLGECKFIRRARLFYISFT